MFPRRTGSALHRATERDRERVSRRGPHPPPTCAATARLAPPQPGLGASKPPPLAERQLLEQGVDGSDGDGATMPARQRLQLFATDDALTLGVGYGKSPGVEHLEHVGGLFSGTALRDA